MRKKGGKCIYLFLDPSPPAEKACCRESVSVCRDSRLMGKHNVDEMSDSARCVCMINAAQHDSHVSPWLIRSHASLAFVN